MNDTTSTPDDPDGHGSVATGGQADAVPEGNGAGTNGDKPAPERVPQPVPRTENGAGDGGSAAAESASPGAVSGTDAPAKVPSPGPSAAPPAPQQDSRSIFEAADEVTTELRLPANGTLSPPSPSPASPSPASPSPAARPSPGRPSPGPAPAPGPVPGPGPAAATPPPWNRVPGPDARGHADGRATESIDAETVRVARPAGGLLDEAPTTFLDAPRPPSDGGSGESAVEGSGSWSPMRNVHNRAPRQASLQLKRLDPWSVLKLALVLAVVLFLVWLVAVGVLYGVLNGMGVWDRLNGTYADLVSGEAPTGSPLISAGRVFGLAAVVGAINSLLFAVAMTVGAFVYNVSADLVGGIEVTLSERD